MGRSPGYGHHAPRHGAQGRRRPRASPSVPPFLDPFRNRLQVGVGLAAQPGHLAVERLLKSLSAKPSASPATSASRSVRQTASRRTV